jgi:hypothetical protein
LLHRNTAQADAGAVVVRGPAKGYANAILVGPHRLLADEPVSAGGCDLGA